MYHRVLPELDPLRPDDIAQADFARCMRVVKRFFNVIPLRVAVEHLKSHSLPPRAVAISFDDGYADNALFAAPVLAALDLPATIFVTTGFLDGGRMWNDTVIEVIRRSKGKVLDVDELGPLPIGSDSEKLQTISRVLKHFKHKPFDQREQRVNELMATSYSLPDDLMLTTEQLQGLRTSEIDVGAHTVGHPILQNLSGDAVENEIVTGKNRLERILGQEVDLFAYPNGKPGDDYGLREVEVVKRAGFRAAVSTAWGSAGPESDTFQLPRIGPWDRQGWKLGVRVLRTYGARNARIVR